MSERSQGSSFLMRRMISKFVEGRLVQKVPDVPAPCTSRVVEAIVRRAGRNKNLHARKVLHLVLKASIKYSGAPKITARLALGRLGIDDQIESLDLLIDKVAASFDRRRMRYPVAAGEMNQQRIDSERISKSSVVRIGSVTVDHLKHIPYVSEMDRAKAAIEEQIVKFARPIEIDSGVYFLVKNGRVVYVGQSINVVNRLSVHSGQKDFDSVCYIKAAPEELDMIESFYIYSLRPKLNGPPRVSIESFLARLSSVEKGGGHPVLQRNRDVLESLSGPGFQDDSACQDAGRPPGQQAGVGEKKEGHPSSA